ncbi:trafficking protein particle complex subunit 2, putative, partial [Plasmodium reichenowi]
MNKSTGTMSSSLSQVFVLTIIGKGDIPLYEA